MHVDYQFHDDATLADLSRLWTEHTAWGDSTFEGVQAWLARSPFGAPCAVVAVDRGTGAVVGQCYFYPTVVAVAGRPVRAARPYGAIVSAALARAERASGTAARPAVALFLHGLQGLAARGTQLVHMVPDPRWAGLLRRSPDLQVAHCPLWSRPLPADSPAALPAGFTAAPLDVLDGRVDRLWEATARRYGCAVQRDAGALRWKLSLGDYAVVGVARDGELVGLAAGKRQGDRQWLVCDVLTADDGEALRATLVAAATVADAKCRAAAAQGKPLRQLHKVGVLATPVMAPVLGTLGFAPDAYRFPVTVQVLDPALSREAVDPARWYASAND